MATKKRYIGLGFGVAAAAAIAHLPAKWVLDAAVPDMPISAAGTIWDGHIARINGLPPIAFKIAPTALLKGTSPVSFSGSGNGISIKGNASKNAVERLQINGDAVFLGQIDGRLSNLFGRFALDAKNLSLSGDCAQASGTVTTDILTKNAARWRWQGPLLSGPITCDDGVLSSTLSGHIPGQSVEAVLKIMPGGDYQIRAVINTNTPEASLVLPLYGFEKNGERYSLNEAGRWM